MNEQQRTIRRLAGYVPEEGDPVAPDYSHREQDVAAAAAEWRDTKLYPRGDIRRIRPELLACYSGHLREYAECGTVNVVESSSIVRGWSGMATKSRVLRVPPEGVDVRTEDAIRLLTQHPLLLDIMPPPEPTETKTSKEKK